MAKMDPDKLGELLSAYADGEVTEEEAQLVERLCQQDDRSRQLVESMQQVKSLVGALPRHAAPPTLAEDVLRFSERAELLDGDGLTPAPRRPSRGPWRMLVSTAAMIAIAAGALYWVVHTSHPRPHRVTDAHPSTVDELLNQDLKVERIPHAGDRPSRSPASVPPHDTKAERKAQTRRSLSGDAATAPGGRKTSPPSRGAPATDQLSMQGKSGTMVADASPSSKPKVGLKQVSPDPVEASIGGDKGVAAVSFGSEPLRLRVTAPNDDVRAALSNKVATILAEHDVPALNTGHGDRANAPGQTAYFFDGVAGVNFAKDSHDRQVLLHVPADVAQDVVSKLAQDADKRVEATLAVGPIQVDGWAHADSVMSSVAASRTRRDGEASQPPAAVTQTPQTGPVVEKLKEAAQSGGKEESANMELVEELLLAMGVNLDSLKRPSPVPAESTRKRRAKACSAETIERNESDASESTPTTASANRPADVTTDADKPAADKDKTSSTSPKGTGANKKRTEPSADQTPADDKAALEESTEEKKQDDKGSDSLVARRLAALKKPDRDTKPQQTAEAEPKKPSGNASTAGADQAARKKQTAAPPTPPEAYVTIVIEWALAPEAHKKAEGAKSGPSPVAAPTEQKPQEPKPTPDRKKPPVASPPDGGQQSKHHTDPLAILADAV